MQTKASTQERLDDLLRDFADLGTRSVGYPCNLDFDYSALLPFLKYSPNNLGDPFHDSNLPKQHAPVRKGSHRNLRRLDASAAR